jgi:hypothetical protein
MIRFVTIVLLNTRRRLVSIPQISHALIWLVAMTCCGTSYGEAQKMTLPAHWFLSGEDYLAARNDYSAALDHTVAYEGSGSGLLKSRSDKAQGATLMQVSSALAYKGKRIRFSAFLRGDEIARRAGLWIRADDMDGTMVAFRNCFEAKAPKSFVQGTTNWKEVEILIDIPDTAADLSFGVQIGGTGTVWIDNASINVIGPYDAARADQVERVPHKPIDPQKLSPAPQNMDFEQ